MNLTALTATLAAMLIIGGLLALVFTVVGRPPADVSRPPARWRGVCMAVKRNKQQIALCVAAASAIYAVTGWPVGAVVAGTAVIGIPRVTSNRVARLRIAKLEALEQWTRRLADLLTASRGLEQALEHSATRNVPAAIAPAVTTLARRLNVTRMPTEQALRLFADDVNDPVGDRIAAALILVARRRGSGAVVVLNRLAEMVVKDVTDRREVEAARAEHRTSIRLIIGIFVAFTAIAIWQRDYIAPFGTLIGQAVLACVAAFYAAGLWWLHRLGSTPPGVRFMSGGDRG